MITIVQENFGIKNFSDAKWCLKIKYSKYVLQQNIHGQKNCANTRKRVPARAVHGQLSRKCHHVVATTWSSLC